jgi:pilus assembly protein CpaF
VLTIRKFAQQPLTLADLVRLETLTPQAAAFLRVCVMERLNILVSGGTGSGKTTTLNALSSFIPSDERIITIEDAAELQLQQAHVVTLESRPPNLEGRGEITIRHLVRNALRMRPDRLILGEVRGSEALDLLMALNTGHDGSLSTIHANGPRDALARLETMTLMAGTELPLRAVREQVASAVQIVLHQERARDGRRRITHISEITGLSGDILSLQEIFRWDTAHNALCATGIRPACTPSLSSEWLL